MSKQKIQDIIIKKKKIAKKFLHDAKAEGEEKLHKFKTENKMKGRFIFFIIAILLLVVLSAKTVDVFAKTIIQVKLHKENLSVSSVLKSSKKAPSDLPFETLELELTEEKSTEATGVREVASKASGQIRVYNAFNSNPQKLVATTRFETADGKIYRIKKSIIVPGAKVENGEIIPSSVETTVYADQPGEEYNTGLTDFTIPGFQGGPRYEKFYARSVTAMTGGFEGEMPVISESDKKDLKDSLENLIKDKLLKKALTQAPEGFLIYEDAIEFNFSENLAQNEASINTKNPKFTIKERGSLFAVLVPEKELSDILVGKYLGEDFKKEVRVTNTEKLNFELITLDRQDETMVFRIKGEAEFVWTIDEEKLKEALIASPDNIEGVFKSYSSIDHVAVVFRPSWWRFFPEKTSKILIEKTD